jgi:hypothetical protein
VRLQPRLLVQKSGRTGRLAAGQGAAIDVERGPQLPA